MRGKVRVKDPVGVRKSEVLEISDCQRLQLLCAAVGGCWMLCEAV